MPSTIGDVLLYTGFLSLSSNNLKGIISESLCNIQYIEFLDLSNSSLSGMVPRCLTTMSTGADPVYKWGGFRGLNSLKNEGCGLRDLRSNSLRFIVWNSGNLNISTLRVLVLRSNKFYGRIRCRKANDTWPVLQIIDLAHNNFSGEVPETTLTSWQAMSTSKDNAPWKIGKLQYEEDGVYYQEDTITVTNKGLEMELLNGSIPEEIGELKSLYALNLSNNAFTGAVPSSLSNSSQLESLDLSSNKLSGQIPLELTKLTFLSFLNLSYNQLVGRIPSGAQFSTFDAASFGGNNGLWAPPLIADNETGFSSPKLEGSHSNPGHDIDWDIISPKIGFTCGFGIVIGSLLFCKRWRKWYYRAMYDMLRNIFPLLEQRFGHRRRHVYVHKR
ncbi:putative leucine-rich repeat domain, L domain-containing protein [Rosa chinensis]|uniref:Putative leucine-rich repeat domain, L domain-containing protein n=1 Tax=Rosa chinensis TaxID=74649 RepID=A0A2P6SGU1_ROSCH|nr:putative leucine-rich repeat domain, L domain-containing protein [Rosa chinensis]